jgi:hypothetical protein
LAQRRNKAIAPYANGKRFRRYLFGRWFSE